MISIWTALFLFFGAIIFEDEEVVGVVGLIACALVFSLIYLRPRRMQREQN